MVSLLEEQGFPMWAHFHARQALQAYLDYKLYVEDGLPKRHSSRNVYEALALGVHVEWAFGWALRITICGVEPGKTPTLVKLMADRMNETYDKEPSLAHHGRNISVGTIADCDDYERQWPKAGYASGPKHGYLVMKPSSLP